MTAIQQRVQVPRGQARRRDGEGGTSSSVNALFAGVGLERVCDNKYLRLLEAKAGVDAVKSKLLLVDGEMLKRFSLATERATSFFYGRASWVNFGTGE